jgi:hypothetical protein
VACQHGATRDLSEGPFLAPVSRRDETPAAHGCICVIVECVACGARRSENRNGLHKETGPWGADRVARFARLRRLSGEWTLAHTESPVRVMVTPDRSDPRRVCVELDGVWRSYEPSAMVPSSDDPHVQRAWQDIRDRAREVLEAAVDAHS